TANQGDGESQHPRDHHASPTRCPQEQPTRPIPSRSEFTSRVKTLTKKFRNAVRFTRLGRDIGQRGPLYRRCIHVEINLAKRQRIACFLLAGQKKLEAVVYQFRALRNALKPLRWRVGGLSQQIALGKDEKYRQSADFAALPATPFQQPEEVDEFDEVRIHLG